MKTKSILVLAVLLTLMPTLFAEPIDFDNLYVASTTYGTVAGDGYPKLLAAYNNDIYFIVFDDGTANPSKVYRYNPSDGLSNAVNHSIVKETTGKFVTLRQIDSSLYFSDNLGHVYSYDGSTLTEMSGTPFTGSDHVSSIERFKGLMYFATSTGNIFRYDGVAFEQVCDVSVSEDRYIRDMATWQKDEYLYVSVGPRNYGCCPPLGYVIRSSSGNVDSWETVFQGFWAVNLFLPTADYLYSAVTDSAYCHCSTVRKSGEGTTFPVIYPSDGQYKRAWGAIYYEEIAYFFADDPHYGFGEIIIDNNGSVSSITNQNWALTQAVELNGEIYALAGSYTGYMPGDVYLITTAVPEPVIKATVDIDPGTLNLQSEGKWITCYIELQEGYDVADINISTVMLNDLVPAESRPTGILDHDGDGILDLMVKFSRAAVQGILGTADQAELTVTGELADGTPFEGSDTIRVVQ